MQGMDSSLCWKDESLIQVGAHTGSASCRKLFDRFESRMPHPHCSAVFVADIYIDVRALVDVSIDAACPKIGERVVGRHESEFLRPHEKECGGAGSQPADARRGQSDQATAEIQ